MKYIVKTLYASGVVFLIVACFLFWQRITPKRLEFEDYSPQINSINDGHNEPIALVIDDIDVRLPIVPSTISNQKWGTTTRGVSYLSSSPVPGEVGNSIMYGHNWKNLLGNLAAVQKGQEIEVIFSNGSKSKFIVEGVRVVDPSDKYILDQSEDARVTLYTCVGFLDSKRFVVTAVLEG